MLDFLQTDFENKVALVTGGSHGIGLAIAKQLGVLGCKVAILGRTDRVEEALRDLRERGITCYGFIHDVISEAPMGWVVDRVRELYGKVDIVVNNVGGGGRWGLPNPLTTDLLVWDQVYKKNATVAVEITLAALADMKRNHWGRVVTISSIYGKEAGGRPWFVMAKAAQIALMKSFARTPDFASSGITFNTVCPGDILIAKGELDKLRADDFQAFYKYQEEKIPSGEIGRPEDVAHLVTFLCSNVAYHINGACITVDGGQSVSF